MKAQISLKELLSHMPASEVPQALRMLKLRGILLDYQIEDNNLLLTLDFIAVLKALNFFRDEKGPGAWMS